MKIDFKNFEIIKTKGKNALDLEYLADVDLVTTTGFWFWKKVCVERVRISRKFASFWVLVQTGQYLPDKIDELERAWNAKKAFEDLK